MNNSCAFPRAHAAARLGVAVLLASLPVAVRAGETAATSVPPRMSVLMGATPEGQPRAFRVHDGTLLDFEAARDLIVGGAATHSNGKARGAAAAVLTTASTGSPALTARVETIREQDAPVALPASTLPADYAVSGFAPTVDASAATSHQAFAADLLAAPARAILSADAAAAWLGDAPSARSVAPVVQPASLAAPAWSAPEVLANRGAQGDAIGTSTLASPVTSAPMVIRSVAAPLAVIPSVAAAPVTGAAKAWGQGSLGELGNGGTTSSSTAVQVTGLTSVTAVAGGATHGLAIQNGAAYAWGDNTSGSIGDGTTTQRNTPVAVSGLTTGVTLIAGGDSYSLALQSGAVKAWGFNADGELGDGTTTQRLTPVAVVGLTSGVTALAGSYANSLAIQNGAVKGWGLNDHGQLGDGTTTMRLTPVQVTGLTSGATAVSAGSYHSLAVVSGAAKAWGLNNYGQVGDNTTTQRLTPVAVLGLSTGVTSVSAGIYHSLAVMNGNVYSWGLNNQGELGNGTHDGGTGLVSHPTPTQVAVGGTPLAGITAVFAAAYSSYALVYDGSLWVWGYNPNGELGLGSTATEFDTPQHLLPPSGFYYSGFSTGSDSSTAFAMLTAGSVPEPSTWLGGLGLVVTAGLTLRRRLAASK